MNVGGIDERYWDYSQAETEFANQTFEFVHSANKAGDNVSVIAVLSQMLINITRVISKQEKIYLNDTHKQIENIFDEISKKYSLTGAEMIKIISSKIHHYSSLLVASERNRKKKRKV